MSHRILIVAGALMLVLGIALRARAPEAQDPMAGGQDEQMKFNVYSLEDTQWQDGPPSLPSGSQFAVLEGDPAKPGPFVFRAKLPDGYRIPPHTHPKVERVTVISGKFHLGMGEKFALEDSQLLPAGTYGFWPAGMKHFAWTEGETVIQVHGEGPWIINYINPADDPRNSRR